MSEADQVYYDHYRVSRRCFRTTRYFFIALLAFWLSYFVDFFIFLHRLWLTYGRLPRLALVGTKLWCFWYWDRMTICFQGEKNSIKEIIKSRMTILWLFGWSPPKSLTRTRSMGKEQSSYFFVKGRRNHSKISTHFELGGLSFCFVLFLWDQRQNVKRPGFFFEDRDIHQQLHIIGTDKYLLLGNATVWTDGDIRSRVSFRCVLLQDRSSSSPTRIVFFSRN